MPPTDFNEHNEHDLDWQAYCYAAGEMSSVDAERFESLLLDSQAAREAVARAVELVEAIAAAGAAAPLATRHSPLATSSSWARIVTWLSLATAASLALVMAGRQEKQPTEIAARGPNAPASADGPALERLTAAWIASRTDADAGLEEFSGVTDEQTFDDPAADANSQLDDDAVYSAPSWLTVAVGGEPANVPRGNEPEGKLE